MDSSIIASGAVATGARLYTKSLALNSILRVIQMDSGYAYQLQHVYS